MIADVTLRFHFDNVIEEEWRKRVQKSDNQAERDGVWNTQLKNAELHKIVINLTT